VNVNQRSTPNTGTTTMICVALKDAQACPLSQHSVHSSKTEIHHALQTADQILVTSTITEVQFSDVYTSRVLGMVNCRSLSAPYLLSAARAALRVFYHYHTQMVTKGARRTRSLCLSQRMERVRGKSKPSLWNNPYKSQATYKLHATQARFAVSWDRG
jgi:hypothetical protein